MPRNASRLVYERTSLDKCIRVAGLGETILERACAFFYEKVTLIRRPYDLECSEAYAAGALLVEGW
jgi:hypothetical protein